MMLKTFALTLGLMLAGNAFSDTITTTTRTTSTVSVTTSLDPTFASWQTVMEQRYTIAYGYSFSPIFDFSFRPLQVRALFAQVFAERGLFCGASLYSVDVAFSPTQPVLTRIFPDINGVINVPVGAIYKLGFVFNQPNFLGGNCMVRLSAFTGGSSGGDHGGDNGDQSADFEFAGVVRYNGGFQDQLAIATDGGAMVQAFWVRVPEFCGQLDILEAGTVSEGHYDAARLVDRDRNIFEVNAGAGLRLSEIRLAINGPRTASCDIPVYFKRTR